jgi:hypothetical protein
MAGWLSKASDAFRKPEPPAPETYEVACDCGGRVAGERTTSVQRPPCPACGTRIFILPANIYPRPTKAPSSKTSPREKSVKSKQGNESTAAKGPSGASSSTKSSSLPPEPPPTVTESGIALDTRVKVITPIRLIVLAMVVVCGLTGRGLWHRYRVEHAKSVVAQSTEAGMKAVQASDFVLAAKELERARDAVDLLKRTDEEAQTVRRLCREAIAARGMADDSLLDVIHKSLSDIQPGKLESKRFDGIYRDTWVLFDSPLLVSSDANQPCVVDVAITHSGRPVRIEVTSNLLRRAAQQAPAETPLRVIFAAKLVQLVPAHDAQVEAQLQLDGDSVVLWTTYETYEALGYMEDDPDQQRLTKELLGRQLEMTR